MGSGWKLPSRCLPWDRYRRFTRRLLWQGFRGHATGGEPRSRGCPGVGTATAGCGGAAAGGSWCSGRSFGSEDLTFFWSVCGPFFWLRGSDVPLVGGWAVLLAPRIWRSFGRSVGRCQCAGEARSNWPGAASSADAGSLGLRWLRRSVSSVWCGSVSPAGAVVGFLGLGLVCFLFSASV